MRLILLLLLLLSFWSPALARGCQQNLPPSAERAGYWRYHVIRGQRCWFGPRRHATRKFTRSAASRGIPASTSDIPAPRPRPIEDEPPEGVWPELSGFDQRWSGE